MLQVGQRVEVVGPKGGPVRNKRNRVAGHRPDSAQLGKAGEVVAAGAGGGVVAALLDGEARPRNFQPGDLRGV